MTCSMQALPYAKVKTHKFDTQCNFNMESLNKFGRRSRGKECWTTTILDILGRVSIFLLAPKLTASSSKRTIPGWFDWILIWQCFKSAKLTNLQAWWKSYRSCLLHSLCRFWVNIWYGKKFTHSLGTPSIWSAVLVCRGDLETKCKGWCGY